MTISNRRLNDRLNNLEAAAEHAPEGTFERTKMAVEAIHAAANSLRDILRQSGLKARNDDNLRNAEVAMFEYLLASNPDDESEFLSAEGFGALERPAQERAALKLTSDRDALAALGLAGATA